MSLPAPIPTNTKALQAVAADGEVVLTSEGPGLAICVSLTPEAVLASLEALRVAAEEAMGQRHPLQAPVSSIDILPLLQTHTVGRREDARAGPSEK
jgi:hypothetical protein